MRCEHEHDDGAYVLGALSPAERTAWVLHDLFGLPFPEVADVVGRSPDAVRQLATAPPPYLLTALACTHFDHRSYEPVDEADKQSCRPDFGVLLTPLHFRFEEMPDRHAKFCASVAFGITEHLPVSGVIGLDELKAPAAQDDVAPDYGLLDVISQGGMPGVA